MGVRRLSWHGVRLQGAGPVDVPGLVRALPGVVAAEQVAAAVLGQDPRRLRHVRTAAAVALDVSAAVPADRLETLLASVVLHDVGYAQITHDTGFHPLDGAAWLARHGAPPDVVAAVAHHSEALLQASARPFLDRYEGLPRPEPVLADVVTYADQTTSPDGRRVGLVRRLRERAARHPAPDEATRTAQRVRVERIVHAVARVDARLLAAGGRDAFLEAVDPGVARCRPHDREPDVALVRAALPGLQEHDGLDGAARVRAALHAARLLAAVGGDLRWHDHVATAVRLLAEAEPSVAPPLRRDAAHVG